MRYKSGRGTDSAQGIRLAGIVINHCPGIASIIQNLSLQTQLEFPVLFPIESPFEETDLNYVPQLDLSLIFP